MADALISGRMNFLMLVACFAGAYTANIQINSGATNLLVGLGNEMILECFVTSDQSLLAPSLTWIYNTTVVQFPVRNQNNGSNSFHSFLTIDNFSKSYVGTYTCMYSDAGGQRNKSFVALSYVIETKTDPEYFYGNQSATLRCDVELDDGKPGEFHEWRKNDSPVSQLTDSYRFTVDNGTLNIKSPIRKDAGPYVARYNVTGVFGPHYDCEVIYRASPLVLDMDKSKNIVEDDELDLICVVKGYPNPNVTWFKDDQAIQQDGHILITYDNTENIHLIIKSVELSDEGKYTCKARGYDGMEDAKSIIVRVKDRLNWLWPVIGIICEAIVLAIVIFICSKVKKDRDEITPTERPKGKKSSHNRDQQKNQ